MYVKYAQVQLKWTIWKLDKSGICTVTVFTIKTLKRFNYKIFNFFFKRNWLGRIPGKMTIWKQDHLVFGCWLYLVLLSRTILRFVLKMKSVSLGFLQATLEPHLRQFELSPVLMGKSTLVLNLKWFLIQVLPPSIKSNFGSTNMFHFNYLRN